MLNKQKKTLHSHIYKSKIKTPEGMQNTKTKTQNPLKLQPEGPIVAVKLEK